jgi:ferritin
VGSFKLIQAVHLQAEVELATWYADMATWTSQFGNVDFKNLAKWSWQTGKVHWEI